MPALGHTGILGSPHAIGAPGRKPRRAESRRWDNVLLRPFRPLVTGSAPDHPAGKPVASAPPTQVMAVPNAQPFLLKTAPRSRLGTVPKLAPGHQGSGLGRPIGAGFQTLEYTGLFPLENSPSRQPDFAAISIPKGNVVPWEPGQVMRPTYRAHDFAPATRFFRQARSAGMWAQAQFTPQQRPLVQPLNQTYLRYASNVARRQVPAAQVNMAQYNIGYPTRVGVAARIGGGVVGVLGSGY